MLPTRFGCYLSPILSVGDHLSHCLDIVFLLFLSERNCWLLSAEVRKIRVSPSEPPANWWLSLPRPTHSDLHRMLVIFSPSWLPFMLLPFQFDLPSILRSRPVLAQQSYQVDLQSTLCSTEPSHSMPQANGRLNGCLLMSAMM